MVNEIRFLILGLLTTPSVVSAVPAQDVEQLERQAEVAQGEERLQALADLLHLARTEAVEGVPEIGVEALRLLEAHPDPARETDVLLSLSWHASRTGDTGIALEHSKRARALAVDRDDPGDVARSDYHSAVAHWYRAEHAEAIATARQACQQQRAIGDTEGLMSTWTLLGAVHRSRSCYDKALACHLEALDLAEELGDVAATARSRNNIGLVYWDIDEHERAQEFLEQVVPVYRELGKQPNLATALSNLGLILVELGEPGCAIPYLEEGLAIYERLGQSRGKAKVYGNLAFAHEALGLEQIALDYNFQALALREALADAAGLARTLGSIAGIHAAAGRHDEAVEFYQRASSAADGAGARDELSSILRGLAGSYEALGQFDLALGAFREHLEIVQDLNTAETARRIAELEARSELKAQRRAHASQRAQGELALERQRLRLALLAIVSCVFLIGLAALTYIIRARSRALAGVRRSHEHLERVTSRLRESEERYRRVFDDAVVPKLLIDLDGGQVMDANGPAELLCGRSREELMGSSLDVLEPGWLAKMAAAPAIGEECHVEEWRDDSGAVRYSELWSTPLSLAGRSCAVVTVYDVTERRKIEEDRIRFERLESLGLLAGGIAHDFNNALTSVLGYVSLARIENGDDALDELLADAESGVDHAASLSSQLIAFAKGGDPQRSLLDVKRLLFDAVHFSLSGSNVRVEFDVSPNLWAAELDEGQFKQVIGNLVINAGQAMPGGGLLKVCARNLVAEQELSSTAGPGQYVRIDIEDEGHGIPADVQGKILDPYFTTKDQGSGLGLSTAFAIVSRHGGWVSFESREGEGTTFSLYYPASMEHPEGQELEDFEVGGSGSILVMDDDPSVHRVFRAALAELGYEVDVVEDGEAALESWFAAKESGRPFDAVIMDLTIPGGMGGKEAMAELRRRDPDAVGIVVSGYSKNPVMSDFEGAGFAGALTKPFNVANLGKLLRRVVRETGPGLGPASVSESRVIS